MKKAQKIAENRLKPNQDFYKWCISHFPIYAFRKSGQIIQSHDRCSKDNRRVIERQIRSNTNFSKLDSTSLGLFLYFASNYMKKKYSLLS